MTPPKQNYTHDQTPDDAERQEPSSRRDADEKNRQDRNHKHEAHCSLDRDRINSDSAMLLHAAYLIILTDVFSVN